MTSTTAEWNRAYLVLENAEQDACVEFRAARKALNAKRPSKGAQAAYDAALSAFQVAGKARWDFEMAAATII